jgi:hypothetical protein
MIKKSLYIIISLFVVSLAHAEIYFYDDMERNFTEIYYNLNYYYPTHDCTEAKAGSCSYKFTHTNPQAGTTNRSELSVFAYSTDGNFKLEDNKEYWYGFSFLIKSTSFDRNWLIFPHQIHGSPDTCDDGTRNPPFNIKLQSDNTLIGQVLAEDDECCEGNGFTGTGCKAYDVSLSSWESAEINIGTWNDIVVQVRFDNGAGTGYANVWLNGVQWMNYSGALGFNDAKGPYLKLGWYGGGITSPAPTMWIDEFRIGEPDDSSYSEVVPGGATPPPDTNPPIRSNGSPSGTLAMGTTSGTLELDTDETATCKYDTDGGEAYSAMANTFSSTNSTSHSQSISGLSNGSSYTYYVRCQDDEGTPNINTDDYLITFSVDDTGGALTNLLSSNTYVTGSDSNSYDPCYALEYLWDDDTNAGVCYATIGGAGITSATPQFDLGQLYDITEINVFGDASGSWICNEWTLEHKQESGDSWTEAWSAADCNADDWDVHDSLSITARYLKFTFTAPTSLQVREAVVYGTVNSGAGGGGGGGGGVISGGGVMSYSSGGAGVIN